MTPRFAGGDGGHCRLLDAESFGDDPLTEASVEKRPDFNDLFRAEHVRAALFTDGLATLTDAIGDVVCLGSEEHVRWVDAGAVVAGMTDGESGRYWPVGEFPREAVRPRAPVVQHEFPVASGYAIGGPVPA